MEKIIEKRLESIFKNVNDWLKFAEEKHAVYIAFSGVAIFGVLNILKEYTKLDIFFKIYLISFLIFLIAGIIISLLSFIPITKLSSNQKKSNKNEINNLLYFGNIQKYTDTDYLTSLYNAYNLITSEYNKIEKDYALQIIINSKICYRKYKYFRISLWLLISGILTPVIGVICYLITEVSHMLSLIKTI